MVRLGIQSNALGFGGVIAAAVVLVDAPANHFIAVGLGGSATPGETACIAGVLVVESPMRAELADTLALGPAVVTAVVPVGAGAWRLIFAFPTHVAVGVIEAWLRAPIDDTPVSTTCTTLAEISNLAVAHSLGQSEALALGVVFVAALVVEARCDCAAAAGPRSDACAGFFGATSLLTATHSMAAR